MRGLKAYARAQASACALAYGTLGPCFVIFILCKTLCDQTDIKFETGVYNLYVLFLSPSYELIYYFLMCVMHPSISLDGSAIRVVTLIGDHPEVV